MNFVAHLERGLRGALLRALSEAPAEAASDVLLQQVIAGTPWRSGLERVSQQLRWLGERGYVLVEDLGGRVFATITQRGLDLVNGLEADPDVARERPR